MRRGEQEASGKAEKPGVGFYVKENFCEGNILAGRRADGLGLRKLMLAVAAPPRSLRSCWAAPSFESFR
jgi:hypothetical protein